MNAPQAIRALEQYFVANYSATPIEMPNGPAVERTEPFIRLTVQVGDSMPNLDSTFKRTVGRVSAQALVPKGGGNLRAWDMAHAAANVLEFKQVGSGSSKVRLTSASFLDAGLVGDALQIDADFYQVNVSVPFWFEEYVS